MNLDHKNKLLVCLSLPFFSATLAMGMDQDTSSKSHDEHTCKPFTHMVFMDGSSGKTVITERTIFNNNKNEKSEPKKITGESLYEQGFNKLAFNGCFQLKRNDENALSQWIGSETLFSHALTHFMIAANHYAHLGSAYKVWKMLDIATGQGMLTWGKDLGEQNEKSLVYKEKSKDFVHPAWEDYENAHIDDKNIIKKIPFMYEIVFERSVLL